MGRFEKYLGEAQKVEIEYADKTKEILELKPLNWEDMNDLMLIGKDFGDQPEKALEKMSNETVERMKKVVLKTMQISYPSEPEEELKAFASRNFLTLFPIILDLNFNVGKAEQLQKIKERVNVRQVPPNKKTK